MSTQDKDDRTTKGGTHEQHVEAGKKGGEAISQDREHMSEIGKKGGEAVSRDREHMAEIGREGGEHSHGGTHEQHVKAGEQSHKNDDKKS